MLSFDLSTTNIILTVAVVGLLIFFLILLMKLNPSTEKKEDFETEIEIRTKPRQTLLIEPQNRPPARVEAPRVAERPMITVGPSVQLKQETPAPASTLNESREISRPSERAPTPAKTRFVSAKRDCIHHFGYLRTFPKNSPIPDECFGCEKIVDCLVSKKSK